ncbi:hypothetical protein HYS50_03435 [Candidatus Woesearchaeota archaeon]|nr:hypothetical protein [Candidatus Woesearchaeota archaeon]
MKILFSQEDMAPIIHGKQEAVLLEAIQAFESLPVCPKCGDVGEEQLPDGFCGPCFQSKFPSADES